MPNEETTSETEGQTNSLELDTREQDTTEPSHFWLRAPWLWLAVLAALGLAMPFVPVPNRTMAIAGAVLATAVHVIAVVLFAVSATRRAERTAFFAGVGILAIAIWAALQFLVAPPVLTSLSEAIKMAGGEPTSPQLLTIVTLQTATSLALLIAAVCGGAVVARLITAPNMLGPICALVAMIDIWGVLFGGIVAQLMERAPEVSQKAMSAAPAVGAASKTGAQYAISPILIGAGDFLFLGLLFAALHLHKMNWRGAMLLTTPLIVLALVALMIGPLPALPGLLFIGLGVAIPNWKYFEYTREEKFALLYAGIFVIILTIALYFAITSMLPEAPA